MTKIAKTSFLLILLALATIPTAHAEEYKPDDMVTFDLSAESWVSTKTARVVLSIEAAVTENTAGSMRASMTKAVNDIVKADWKLTSFNRGQDQTGMERWSAVYEARVKESDLTGLNDQAKKVSKAGMQITVSGIDFSPTLEETQATMALLRTDLYKQANDQLVMLNNTITGRNFRISSIAFGDATGPVITKMARAPNSKVMTMAADGGHGFASESDSMSREEKITMTAHIVYAALPTAQTKDK